MWFPPPLSCMISRGALDYESRPLLRDRVFGISGAFSQTKLRFGDTTDSKEERSDRQANGVSSPNPAAESLWAGLFSQPVLL